MGQRNLDVSDCNLEMTTKAIGDGYKRLITFKVSLPANFPDKYHSALEKVLTSCTAKKIIEAGLEFKYEIS